MKKGQVFCKTLALLDSVTVRAATLLAKHYYNIKR